MIPLNHQFFAAVLLSIICIIVSLAGALSDDWGSGSALIGGSDYYSNVKLGLWYGSTKAAKGKPATTFYYEWCETNTAPYEPTYCFELQAARVGACAGINLMVATLVVVSLLSTYVVKMRLEPTMARVSAVFSGVAAGSFLMCVAVWAKLVLDLSKTGGASKAQLSIGMSWLAQAGGFIVAVLTTLNLIFAARRVDQELAVQNLPIRRKSQEVRGQRGVSSSTTSSDAHRYPPPSKPHHYPSHHHQDGRSRYPSDAEIRAEAAT